jgi:hypothetical protein
MAASLPLGSLTKAQGDLIRETEPARLADLDEDALLHLHARVRRGRSKYVGLYRRQGAARVAAKGARGKAASCNRINAERAEVFELALARVSKRIDVVARAAAAELPVRRRPQAGQARRPLNHPAIRSLDPSPVEGALRRVTRLPPLRLLAARATGDAAVAARRGPRRPGRVARHRMSRPARHRAGCVAATAP